MVHESLVVDHGNCPSLRKEAAAKKATTKRDGGKVSLLHPL